MGETTRAERPRLILAKPTQTRCRSASRSALPASAVRMSRPDLRQRPTERASVHRRLPSAPGSIGLTDQLATREQFFCHLMLQPSSCSTLGQGSAGGRRRSVCLEASGAVRGGTGVAKDSEARGPADGGRPRLGEAERPHRRLPARKGYGGPDGAVCGTYRSGLHPLLADGC